MKKNSSLISVIELLSARLFHEVAGSIGAIANCVEFLSEEDDEMHGESTALLNESSDDLISRFKILRQAYSFSDNNSSMHDTKYNIEKYLGRKKVELQWDLENLYVENASIIERINKILVNIIVVCVSAIFEGRVIKVAIENSSQTTQLKVTCKATKISFDQSAAEILLKKASDTILTTKNIQAYFITLLLRPKEEIFLTIGGDIMEVVVALQTP